MRETGLLVLYKTALTLLVFLSSGKVYLQKYPDEQIHTFLKTGIEKIVNQDYKEAAKIFSTLDQNYPAIPLGKIYSAAVEITKAYDYGIDFNSESINNNLEKALKTSDELLEKDPENIWNLYFYALTEGYAAYFNALEGNYLGALNNGYSAMTKFEKCLSIDSAFYDAYTAVGVYKYWKSRMTEFINWIPLITDEREEGIKNVIHALDHFTYNKHLAANSLMWIYIDRKEFSKAIKLADEMLKIHPKNRQFKWGLARAYEDIDKEKATTVYYEILDSYKKLNLPNRSQEITLLHIIAQQYEKSGNKEKALMLCREITNSNISAETKEKLGQRLSRIEEMERKLTEKE
jgi:tetratricopeptide (TPR) repeat protein